MDRKHTTTTQIAFNIRSYAPQRKLKQKYRFRAIKEHANTHTPQEQTVKLDEEKNTEKKKLNKTMIINFICLRTSGLHTLCNAEMNSDTSQTDKDRNDYKSVCFLSSLYEKSDRWK